MNCSYDAEKKVIYIAITSNIITKYYSKLPEFLAATKGLPDGVRVERKNHNTIKIALPVVSDDFDEASNVGQVAVDGSDINLISETINDFANAAIRQELKTIDFVPLSGYPVKMLMQEIISAVKEKRDLCIIKDFEVYVDKVVASGTDYNFPQYRVEYDSEEYCDIASYLYEGDIKSVAKLTKNKIKPYSWL